MAASKTPAAVQAGPNVDYSQKRGLDFGGPLLASESRSRVWIHETKVWGRRYGKGMEPEV